MTSHGSHRNDGERLPVFPKFGENTGDVYIKQEEIDYVVRDEKGRFPSYTTNHFDGGTSVGLFPTSSDVSVKPEKEDYGFDSDGDDMWDSSIKKEIDMVIKQALGSGIESESETDIPRFKEMSLPNTKFNEERKDDIEMNCPEPSIKRYKFNDKYLVTPLRTSNRLRSGKEIISLQKSIAKKKLRKVEDDLQSEDCVSLLAADLMHRNIDHGKDLPAVSALRERLGEAVNTKWPLFQQITEELCAFSSKANTNRHLKLQTMHMYLATKLIKNCLLSGCHADLSLAILPLTSFPKKSPELLWKVGTELLKRNARPDCSMFLNMMKMLLYHVQQTNVFICQGINSICDSLTNLRSVYHEMSEVISSERFSGDPYMKVFYGQLEYMLWKEEKEKWALNKNALVDRKNLVLLGWGVKDEEEEEEEFGVNDLQTVEEPMEMTYHGKRALIYLHCVTQRNGVWDLILPKYVEVASQYQEESDVWRALKLHAENNRHNPMSYCMQLQWMTRKGGFDIDEMIDVYNKLAQIDSTNNMVKSLCIILNKEKNSKELFGLLMRRLSHLECFDSSFDWNLLLGLLKSDDEIRTMFDTYLRLHETWKKTHFAVSTNSNNFTLSSEVRAAKAEIVELLNLYEDIKPVKDSIHLKPKRNSNSHRVQLSTINLVDDYDEDLREKQYEWMFSYDDVSSPEMLSVEDLSIEDSLTEDSSTDDSSTDDGDSSSEDGDSSVDKGDSSAEDDDSSTEDGASFKNRNSVNENRSNQNKTVDDVGVSSSNGAVSPILFYGEQKEQNRRGSSSESDENVDIKQQHDEIRTYARANKRLRGVKRKLSTSFSDNAGDRGNVDSNRKRKCTIGVGKRKKKKLVDVKDDVTDENWNPLTKNQVSYKEILNKFLKS